MDTLDQIGMWYEKMPEHLRTKHFSSVRHGEKHLIEIDNQDELALSAYIRNYVPQVNKEITLDFVRYFSDYCVFVNSGKKVVTIADSDLKEALFQTDIDKMTTNDLNLPFDYFYVELGLRYNNPFYGSEITIEGAYVSKLEDCLHIVTLEKHSNLKVPVLTFFDVYDNAPIAEQIEKIVQSFQSHYGLILGKVMLNNSKIIEHDRMLVNQIVKLFSILFFLDYAQREQKESLQHNNLWKPYMKPNPKESKKKINLKKIKAYHYINLVLPKHLKEDHSIKQDGIKQSKMTLVRGHWRRQPYGAKNEEKIYKTIWIKPFWKNLDSELDAKKHVYKIV